MLSRKVLQSAVASGTSNSQQGGPVIKHVPTPSTRRPPRLKRRQRTPAAEGGTMGEKMAGNFEESGDFHVTFEFFYML